MTVTFASISTANTNAAAANKPILLAQNVLESGASLSIRGEIPSVDATVNPETICGCWRSSNTYTTSPIGLQNTTTSTYVGTLISGKALFAHSTEHGSFTSPLERDSSTSYKSHALIFRIPENTSTNPIDSLVIGAHNFSEINNGDSSNPLMVTVHVADNYTFAGVTGSVYQIAQFNITDSFQSTKRIVDLRLGAGDFAELQYYGVKYIQVVISQGGGFIAPPQIGELFLGPRRQLSRYPTQESFELDETENAVGVFNSKAGVKRFYRISSGREIIRPNFTPGGDPDLGTTDLYTLDDLSTLESFWADTDYGAKPFFFIPKPLSPSYSAPTTYFMYSEKLEFPAIMQGGLTDRSVEFEFRELSPYVSSEE